MNITNTFIVLLYIFKTLLAGNVCYKISFYCLKEYKNYNSKKNLIKSNQESHRHSDNRKDMASNSGLNNFYRPRSALARALYEKQRNDGQLRDLDKSLWYRIDKSRLSPEMEEKFVQLEPDDETKDFISQCIDKSSWIWTQIWYLLAKAVLKYFWTITDINGWLGRGSMFVLSRAQASSLLTAGGSMSRSAVVDIGAGDGEVGRRFAGLFEERYATEISSSMRKMLATKGYSVLDADTWHESRQFSCVCMLNVLDRCSKPRSALRAARLAAEPHARLLVALVLPYKPYVEVTSDHKPEERLPISGSTFEEQAASFVVFMRSEGWSLTAWSRAPYLCEGDFSQSYYWLDDSIYAFTPDTEHLVT